MINTIRTWRNILFDLCFKDQQLKLQPTHHLDSSDYIHNPSFGGARDNKWDFHIRYYVYSWCFKGKGRSNNFNPKGTILNHMNFIIFDEAAYKFMQHQFLYISNGHFYHLSIRISNLLYGFTKQKSCWHVVRSLTKFVLKDWLLVFTLHRCVFSITVIVFY